LLGGRFFEEFKFSSFVFCNGVFFQLWEERWGVLWDK